MTTPATTPTAPSTRTDAPAETDLTAGASHGSHAIWGDAQVIHSGEPIDRLLPGEILVVDELTTDLLGFLPLCAAVIIESAGPWESAIPGILHTDFTRSGAAALLRALDIPHAWNLPGATTTITTGDLVHLDPVAGAVWTMPIG